MVMLGALLLVLGVLFHISLLTSIGIILLVIGAVLFVLSAIGGGIEGRRFW